MGIKYNSRVFWGSHYKKRLDYDKAVKEGCEWKYLLGEEQEYRFINQFSYLRCLTDPMVLLEVCAYRRSEYGDKDIAKRYEEILFDFLKSEIPIRVYQVCCFISAQEVLFHYYTDMPFMFEVRDLVPFAEEIILKNEYALLEYEINELRKCLYFNVCYIIRNSASFQKYGSHYDEFCSTVKEFIDANRFIAD